MTRRSVKRAAWRHIYQTMDSTSPSLLEMFLQWIQNEFFRFFKR